MNSELPEVTGTLHYFPSISIIMPFDPKMCPKSEITKAINVAVDKVALEVNLNYAFEIARLVIAKLRTLLQNLNYYTHKKSIAIYVSPVFEKVLYLDIPVEEKVMVDESFEIRDLVYSKKQLHKYLVLLLGAHEYKILLGCSETLTPIVCNSPESILGYINDVSEKTGCYKDYTSRKEIVLDKYLHLIDSSLGVILNAYPLPLFVLGGEKLTGQFKNLTNHKNSIVEYIYGRFGDASIDDLRDILEIHTTDWEVVKQKKSLINLKKHRVAGNWPWA